MASPELQEIIDMLRQRVADTRASPALEQRRAATDTTWQMFEDLEGIATEAVNAGGVSAEWVVAPDTSAGQVILYLHGGGYVVGSIVSHRGLAANLSRATGARVLNLDYRLAPENPFPAPVEDSLRAYSWLIENGTSASNIVVAGDTAGGGLTVATLVALKEAGDPLPAAGVCISPWVDMEALGESMTTRAHLDPTIQKQAILDFAKQYLGDADPRSPLAAPIYANLTGIPPLLILVGTSETLYDDAARLAQRAEAAGVDVVFDPYDAMIHVWPRFGPKLPEAMNAMENIGSFVRKRLSADDV